MFLIIFQTIVFVLYLFQIIFTQQCSNFMPFEFGVIALTCQKKWIKRWSDYYHSLAVSQCPGAKTHWALLYKCKLLAIRVNSSIITNLLIYRIIQLWNVQWFCCSNSLLPSCGKCNHYSKIQPFTNIKTPSHLDTEKETDR